MLSLLEVIIGMLVDDVSSSSAVVVDTVSVELGMMFTVEDVRISTNVDVTPTVTVVGCREVLGVTLVSSAELKAVVATKSTVVGVPSIIETVLGSTPTVLVLTKGSVVLVIISVTVLGSTPTVLVLSEGSIGVVTISVTVVVGTVPMVVTSGVVTWVGASVTGFGTE